MAHAKHHAWRPALLVLLACACAVRAADSEPAPSAPASDPLSFPSAPPATDVVYQNPAASLGGELAPAPAVNPVPSLSTLPPVPYYSAFSGPMPDLPYDPALENAGLKLGWFGAVEAAVVHPFVHSLLNSGTSLGMFATPVQTPYAQANVAAMPRVEVAYRWAQGLGEVRASFRFLSSSGTRTDAMFDAAGPGTITSRLDLDVFDLDFACTEFMPIRVPRINPLLLIPGHLGLNDHPEDDPTFPPLLMRWSAGARVANVYFDSQGTGALVSERVMNNFKGGGMHMAVEFTKAMPWNPLSAYFRVDGAGVLGNASQTFSRTAMTPAGPTVSGSSSLSRLALGVPVLSVQAGMSWVPPWRERTIRVSGGYQYEQWWYLGQTSSSLAELTLQGMFLKGEVGF